MVAAFFIIGLILYANTLDAPFAVASRLSPDLVYPAHLFEDPDSQ